MDSLFLATVVIGVVEFIKSLNEKDWEGAEIIFCAALVGAVAGIFQIDNLTILTGIQAGIAASGIYKGAKLIGGTKNNPPVIQ